MRLVSIPTKFVGEAAYTLDRCITGLELNLVVLMISFKKRKWQEICLGLVNKRNGRVM